MNTNRNKINPLQFQNFVKDLTNNQEFFKLINLLINAKESNLIGTNYKFLGKGKNGIVYKIGKDTTIKIIQNINLNCPINNEFVKFCTGFYNEVMIGMILSNLVTEKLCYNFPTIKGAYVTKDIGVIVRNFSDFVFEDFLKTITDQKLINNLIIQYFLAIAIIHSKYQSNMLDNKFTNLYIKKINNENLIYEINGKKYEIPCYGYVIVIGDYGSSKFNYPTGNYFVQMVKYTDAESGIRRYLKDIERFKNVKSNNKSKNLWEELHFEKVRQIYFEGLFNPYIEHVFFMSFLIKFAKEHNRSFDIINDYVEITNYNRNGILLLRKNISLIQLINTLSPKYNITIN